MTVSTSEMHTHAIILHNQHKDNSTLLIRHLEESDIRSAVQMIVQEYGSSYPTNPPLHHTSTHFQFVSTLQKEIASISSFLEDWMLGFTASVGLYQRTQRRKHMFLHHPSHNSHGKSMKPNDNDHNIMGLFYTTLDQEDHPILIGMVEVSLHPTNPLRLPPPYVLPIPIKQMISNLDQVTLSPYLSNLLIQKSYRGRGYSKVLIQTCEQIAQSWNYTDLYLHVDADVDSGKIAQSLYLSLGYELVSTPIHTRKDSSVDSSIYFVDGVPLLYLRKKLRA